MKKPIKPEFDAEGYQVNLHDLNGEALPKVGSKFKPFLHGGAREGAGRKPVGRKPVLIRLRPVVIKRLRAIAKREKRSISDIAEEKLANL